MSEMDTKDNPMPLEGIRVLELATTSRPPSPRASSVTSART